MAIRRVMVPIDYSDNSKAALAYGAELALGFGASLDIVHVWDRPTYLTDAVMVQRPGEAHKPIGELIRENAERDMTEFLSEVSLPTTLSISRRLVSGEPASALLAELKKGEHDLVVLSTHGRTGLAHLLLGSIAEKLVRLSPVPVLTVPVRSRS
ncbi:MAG TPA: universal stress protein [Polyangiaceae bacterium]|nr:universal stress protein [Polyangiaceae bacterium]